jgi:hypothetical protein
MKSLSVKLGVILIGLTIFGCGEVRGADCAWVLWFKQVPGSKSTPANEFWEINEAFPTYKECSEAQKNLFFSMRSSFKNMKMLNDAHVKEVSISDTPNTWMNVWVELKTGEKVPFGTFEFKCLPDTIDPRK